MLFIIFNSCEKQLDEKTIKYYETLDKKEFIINLTESFNKTSISDRSVIDPENLNNQMDDFGVYFKEMFLEVNSSETVNPSFTREQYLSKYETYLANNPSPFNLSSFVSTDFEFYRDLFLVVKSSSQGIDPVLAVEQIKVFEDIINDTSLLTELEKSYLLTFSSFLKYVRATFHSEEIIVGDIVIGIDDFGFWDCFDDVFMETTEKNLGVLGDTDSPVLMVAAWIGFPVTVTASVGDAVYQGITDCW